ncbi:MAG: hypothetical protein V3V97_19580, partial [Hyphomicrobiaceae bacterium]
ARRFFVCAIARDKRSLLERGPRRPVALASRVYSAHGYSSLRSGLRGRGAKRRRPVGLASLRSEPERDGEGVAEER